MAKITYENKVELNVNSNIADVNKCNATDLNEIKKVVNTNDDKVGDLAQLNTTNKDNLVGAINEIKQNIMSLSMADDQSVVDTFETDINFSRSTSVGNKLIFDSSNHSIKIGANVTKIKVSFNASVINKSRDIVWFKIIKNGTDYGLWSLAVGTGNFGSTSLSPAILDVSENDNIKMIVKFATANDLNYVRSDGTNMIVEVVE